MDGEAVGMQAQIFLNRYEVVQPLGEGGMGRVYLARQMDEGRPVVVKVMHARLAADPRFRQHFQRETQLMSRFQHPHAVTLYDASLDGPDEPCIVMEYVPGVTLEVLVRRHGRLPAERVGRLLGQLCSVLGAAHSAGILHRDLTAVNMMIMDADKPTEKLKVMDFGLARAGSGPYFALEKLTGNGKSIGGGTPDYVCPEQIRNEEVDHRGDLYSVGVLLFKLLTGRLPFQDAATVAAILRAHVERKPPTFAAVGARAAVTPAMEAVVQSCLAKYPHERPQSARELGERFEKALGCKILLEDAVPPTPAVIEPARPRINPRELVDYLEAWMPESIAVVKLRGFVGDLGGEVIGSEPGLVRVRLPRAAKAAQEKPSSLMAWFGLTRPSDTPADMAIMELHMERKPGPRNQLGISVLMRPERPDRLGSPATWKTWCTRVCRELRAYLISG
jgi:serine/threonine-protein kinase